jgi:hypothetical protein|tara:strand:+ start:644 stop:961 length:318 start_codon:yes stop_codon:yes gene_type:complete
MLKLVLTSENAVLNITGYSYTFTLKDNIDDSDPGVVQVTATPSVSTSPTEASQGILYISVARNLTNGLTAQTYNYDVQQKDTSGDVQTLLIGKVKVVKDVTRTVS